VIAVDETVEDVAKIEAAHLAHDPGIAHDLDGATVRQQVIELRLIRELVDAVQVDPEELARPLGRGPDLLKIDVFAAEIGSHAHQIAPIADDVD
jgi:hypothetical protein